MDAQSRRCEHRRGWRSELNLGKSPFDEARVEVARCDVVAVEEGAEEFDVGRDTQDDGVGEGTVEGAECFGARGPVGDDLREHGVIVGRDRAALDERAVNADALSFVQMHDLTCGGQEVVGGIFGVNACLNRVAGKRWRLHCQLLTSSDSHLPLHEVDASDHFGDGMLHLQSGVHLHEEELVGRVVGDEELDGSCTDVAHAARDLARCFADALPGCLIEQRRRRFFDDLLVATLQRTFAFTQVNDRAVAISQNLHLDVAGLLDEALEKERVIAERGTGHAPSRVESTGNSIGLAHDRHALATATGRRLDQQREPDLGSSSHQIVVRHTRLSNARDHRDTAFGHVHLRRNLVAHNLEGFNAGTDKRDSGSSAGLG